MRFSLEIACDNAAFADDTTGEVARILRAVADRLDGQFIGPSISMLDGNGNHVGEAEFLGT